MTDGLTEMRVIRLVREDEAFLTRVLLEGAADPLTSMTIALPASHAVPLVHALEPADTDCSSVCDAILAAVRRLDAAVVEAVIDQGQGWLTARLVLGRYAAPLTCSCEVVDALTLAVRANAPIYATRRALDCAALLALESHQTRDRGQDLS